MIKIKKMKEPQILIDNAKKWTKEYLDCILNNIDPPEDLKSKYRIKEIKEELLKETNYKCAYCESKLRHVSFGDVEHILPKAKGKRPELIFEWSNLTIACEICNRTGKKMYYDVANPLVNPYVDNPEEFLFALGPMIFHRTGNLRGEITQKVLDLNRKELIEQRADRLKSIETLVDKWVNERNPKLKDIIKNEILKEIENDKEYSFTVKSYLHAVNIL